MRRILVILLLAGVTLSATACVVEEPGPGPGHDRWCFWHPGRCR